MLVYLVTNKINRKQYVGKAKIGFNQRKSNHYSSAKNGSETNFHRALRKYDKESFVWEILEECKSDEDMSKKEMFYIEKYNTYKQGYNMTEGGEGGLTYNKNTDNYHRIKNKLGKWKNGNPGATPQAIQKRKKTFENTTWISGKEHGNYGHTRNKGKFKGKDNPQAKSCVVNGMVYETLKDASISVGVSPTTIRRRINKNIKGYKWNIQKI